MKSDFVIVLLLATACSFTWAAEDSPVIAVASSFVPAMEDIATQFTAATGHAVRISSGATGTLVSQIEWGAPFELFLSADAEHVFYLRDRGLVSEQARLYAIGVLVLYLPEHTRLQPAADVARSLVRFFQGEGLRLAIANPELAPYGRAAREVLERFGNWQAVEQRVILGENVGQTAQFALSGAVDAALLPRAMAQDPALQSSGRFLVVPADWYVPIRQWMVLLKHAGNTAAELYDFLSSDAARAIITRHGYELPPS